MKRFQIGTSGIEVAALGMGCWAYGGGDYWGEQAQSTVNDVVAMALDAGINYFDTAEVYNGGASEAALGEALKSRRQEAVIGSKVSTSNAYPSLLRAHCEASLKRLQTDYLDIYMLHWPVNATSIAHFAGYAAPEEMPPLEAVFETLLALKQEGKIREIGVSNHGVKQMEEIRKLQIPLAVNELPYNLISRGIEAEILPACRQNEIAVLGYMAYQQGILTKAHRDLSALRPSQLHSRHFHQSRGEEQSRHYEEGAEREIFTLLSGMEQLSKELGVSVATLSLSWALGQEGIASTLVGSRNREELAMNIEAANFLLPQETRAQLNRLSQPILEILGDNPDYYENRKNSRIW